MSEDLHERAARLIAAAHLEGLSGTDRAWLDEHLESCAICAARAVTTEQALRALRTMTIPVRPTLISATQVRVHLRARELRERQARIRALWLSCALSWVLGVVSAPVLWRGFAWVGHRMDLPDAVWISAFALWWITPAALVVAILTWRRLRASDDYGDKAMLPR